MFLTKINETDQLINLIHEQNSNYMAIMLWIFGVMATIILGFFSVQLYLNKRQVKEIKKETLIEVEDKYIKELKEKLLKQAEVTMGSVIEQAKTELNYLSSLDNKKIEEIKFATESIKNHISLIYKSPDISNECLGDLVNEINEKIKLMEPINNSNGLIAEALQRIRRDITFNVNWIEVYEETKNKH